MKNGINKKVRYLCIIVLLGIMLTYSAHAATYYVGTNGNDSNPGSSNLPWRTVQKAADTMGSGDTVLVNSGSYDERITTKRSGAANQYIEFRANGAVTISSFTINGHNYIKLNGFRVSAELGNYKTFIMVKGSQCIVSNNFIFYNGNSSINGIGFGESSYCTIVNNTIQGLKYPNITLAGNNHTITGNTIKNTCHDAMRVFGHSHVIRGNTFQDMYSDGRTHVDLFQTFGDNGGISYNILIENNHFKNCKNTQIGNFTQDGVSDIRDWTFRNNVFENIQYQANIYVPGFKFYNNIFYHCDQNTGGPLLFKDGGATRGIPHNGAVVNNLFIDCGSRPTNTGWYSVAITASGFYADFNYVAGPASSGFPSKQGFKEPNGINGGDPKFVSIAGSDFGLQEDSPAIDSGMPIGGFNTDKNGKVRPQGKAWDRGAYEGVSKPGPSGLRIIGSGSSPNDPQRPTGSASNDPGRP